MFFQGFLEYTTDIRQEGGGGGGGGGGRTGV